MSHWEKRNGIKNCPSKRYWYNDQGRVENKQSHPSHNQQEDNPKYKAISATRQIKIYKGKSEDPKTRRNSSTIMIIIEENLKFQSKTSDNLL